MGCPTTVATSIVGVTTTTPEAKSSNQPFSFFHTMPRSFSLSLTLFCFLVLTAEVTTGKKEEGPFLAASLAKRFK